MALRVMLDLTFCVIPSQTWSSCATINFIGCVFLSFVSFDFSLLQSDGVMLKWSRHNIYSISTKILYSSNFIMSIHSSFFHEPNADLLFLEWLTVYKFAVNKLNEVYWLGYFSNTTRESSVACMQWSQFSECWIRSFYNCKSICMTPRLSHCGILSQSHQSWKKFPFNSWQFIFTASLTFSREFVVFICWLQTEICNFKVLSATHKRLEIIQKPLNDASSNLVSMCTCKKIFYSSEW
jgi:hypothetical protein